VDTSLNDTSLNDTSLNDTSLNDLTLNDRVAQPGYLDGLKTRPLDEIRSMRAECGQLEAQLSYARRLVQGRLDIVQAERMRRAAGMAPSDLADLVAALPEMLSPRVLAPRANGASRVTGGHRSHDIGDQDDPELEAELDAVFDGSQLVALPAASDEHVASVAEKLADLERDVSQRRRAALEAFDTLSAEMVRRFRTGEATVDLLD
jgi:hypothetical protein